MEKIVQQMTCIQPSVATAVKAKLEEADQHANVNKRVLSRCVFQSFLFQCEEKKMTAADKHKEELEDVTNVGGDEE